MKNIVTKDGKANKNTTIAHAVEMGRVYERKGKLFWDPSPAVRKMVNGIAKLEGTSEEQAANRIINESLRRYLPNLIEAACMSSDHNRKMALKAMTS